MIEVSAPAKTKKRKRLTLGWKVHRVREIPCLALTIEEAARACGVSPETFDRHIRPHVDQVPVSPGVVIFRPEAITAWLAKVEDRGSGV